jgi:hypothetical protein
MRHARFHSLLVLSAALVFVPPARGDVLEDKQPDGFYENSQRFTDLSTFSMYGFHRLTVGHSGWIVDKVTIYGKELGNPHLNIGVYLAFLPVPDACLIDEADTCPGYEDDDGNLVFDKLNVYLGPGIVWVGSYVARDYFEGHQWYWQTSPIDGNEAWFHNPGGGHGWGTEPFRVSAHMPASDLALRIDGRLAVPPSPP